MSKWMSKEMVVKVGIKKEESCPKFVGTLSHHHLLKEDIMLVVTSETSP